jgi:hypothetical protein
MDEAEDGVMCDEALEAVISRVQKMCLRKPDSKRRKELQSSVETAMDETGYEGDAAVDDVMDLVLSIWDEQRGHTKTPEEFEMEQLRQAQRAMDRIAKGMGVVATTSAEVDDEEWEPHDAMAGDVCRQEWGRVLDVIEMLHDRLDSAAVVT